MRRSVDVDVMRYCIYSFVVISTACHDGASLVVINFRIFLEIQHHMNNIHGVVTVVCDLLFTILHMVNDPGTVYNRNM